VIRAMEQNTLSDGERIKIDIELNNKRKLEIADNRMENLKRSKFRNSTGTMYVDDTILKPSNNRLILSAAKFVHSLILENPKLGDKKLETKELDLIRQFDLFDETIHGFYPRNSTRHNVKFKFHYLKEDPLSFNPNQIPKVSTVENVINQIFTTGDLASEAIVLGLVYLNRLRDSGFSLYPFNWRRSLCVCLVMASKVWEDSPVWNADFASILSPKDMKAMEGLLLNTVKFDVLVKSSEFAKVYFELRTVSPLLLESELKPLDQEKEKRLEANSKKYQDRAFSLSKSQGFIKVKPKI